MDAERLRYFAACNSENGFQSFYPEVFTEELAHVYIIKGGPGTGKSSLMRRVADCAETRGYVIEEIRCSSDPSSLDGILAKNASSGDSFAVLDGTAPHVTEMTLPGARDEILYVGDFWDAGALSAHRGELARFSRARKQAYERLYRYLQAAGQCERNMTEAVLPHFDRAACRKYLSELLSRYPTGKGFSVRRILTCSIGMEGVVRFPVWQTLCDTVYAVHDHSALGYLITEEIIRQAERRQMSLVVSRDPLMPEYADAVMLPECRLGFVLFGRGETERVSAPMRRLSMRRFLTDDDLEASLRAAATAQKCRDRLMRAALETAGEIRRLHFSLEERYASAMDFDAMRARTDAWIQKILP